jgi:hypothetical protein
VRAGVENNRHSEVEHPDAWAHRYLDELDRAYATAVREMSTGAGGAANEKGAPAIGVPLGVGVWLPVPGVDLWLDVNDPRVVAEVGRDIDRRGHTDRRVDGRVGFDLAAVQFRGTQAPVDDPQQPVHGRACDDTAVSISGSGPLLMSSDPAASTAATAVSCQQSAQPSCWSVTCC